MSTKTGLYEMDETSPTLPTAHEHHVEINDDDGDEDLSVTVIPKIAFHNTGASLNQDEVPPNTEETESDKASPQEPTIQHLSKEELGAWIQEQFQRATEGDEATWHSNQVHLTTDRTNETDYQTYLTVSDTGGTSK